MLFLWNLLFFIAKSQNSFVEVTYNNQVINIYNRDLTVAKVRSIFSILDFSYLEDLSAKRFYPLNDGSFPSSISTVVYVRQLQPKMSPTVIPTSEAKFVFSNRPWHAGYGDMCIGFVMAANHQRTGYIILKT